MKPIYILAIESSCDDTSAAVLCDTKVLSNCIASQKIHEHYGGVVPELASRAHQQNIVPVVDAALQQAGITKEMLHAVAFTRGPGLLGSLLVGVSFAKAFAWSLNIPMIEVNHMQAHILAHCIHENNDGSKNNVPSFPFMCLTVSGGHTQIVLVKDPHTFELLGETNDDAAGEAFDKSAKILGLPYPGGPLIDKYSEGGDIKKFKFPKPQVPGYNFSFSGLKTSFLNFINKESNLHSEFVQQELSNICASIQHTIVSYTVDKLIDAAKEYGVRDLAIAGGVSANSYLRKYLQSKCDALGYRAFIPRSEYCTDNAAMIGVVGYYKFLKEDFCGLDITPLSRYDVGNLK
jgi:N6-L-threonylcarbamoyladenine synthase